MIQELEPKKTYYNNIIIETKRLILRNLTLDDSDDVLSGVTTPMLQSL